MKTLKDHTLIYDDECPLCNTYTKAFIRMDMLDKEGREKFSEIENNPYGLDLQRSRNEIALVNKKDHSITYGIYSLFKIIGNNFPILKPLLNFKPFQYLMSHFYFFISFNRKVIIPGKTFEAPNSCTPSLNIGYRFSYLIITWLSTSIILYHYSRLLFDFIPHSNFYRELLISGGQIVFQAFIIYFINKKKILHYLGNLMTVSMAGAILLIPMFVINYFISSEIFFLSYFIIVDGLMFLEHARRVKILLLPFLISITWVLYRILVLFLIL